MKLIVAVLQEIGAGFNFGLGFIFAYMFMKFLFHFAI